MPLITTDGGLIDLELEAVSDEFRPANPHVPVSLPKDPREPVAVGDGTSSFLITLEGVEPTHGTGLPVAFTENLVDEAVLYPNTQQDTDSLLLPTTAGIQTFTQVRTEGSPEEARFGLSLPAGVRLSSDQNGGAIATFSSGDPFLTVSQPSAIDAEGENVPVTLSLDDSSVVLEFPHRGMGFAYPILVDPVYELYESFSFFDSTHSTYHGWSTYQAGSSNYQFDASCPSWMMAFDPCGGTGHGLYTSAPPGLSFAANSDARWLFTPPGNTTNIFEAWLDSWRYRKGSSTANNPRAYYGIATGYLWNSYVQLTAGGGGSGLHLNGGPSARQLATGLTSPTLSSMPSGWQNFRYNRLANFTVRMGDGEAPTVVPYGTYPLNDGWIAASPDKTRAVLAADNGLGVAWFEATMQQPGGSEQPVDGADLDCAGGYADPCASLDGWTFPYNGAMGEGQATFRIRAYDALGKPSAAYSWQSKLDPAPPRLSLHGPLSQKDGTTVADESLRLKVVGADDLATADGTSGLHSLQIKLDGVVQPVSVAACPDQDCVRLLDWTLDTGNLTTGPHTIEVKAIDVAGNATTREISLNVADARIKWPRSGDTSAKRFPLKAEARGNAFNKVTFQYRRDTLVPTWTDIPVGRVISPEGHAISSWPVPVDSNMSEDYSWNAWGTTGLTASGPLQLRAVFVNTATSATYATPAIDLTLNPSATGSTRETVVIGPGEVDLLTGNLTIMQDDVNINAYTSDLVFSRTYASRAPNQNPNGSLGPGWLTSAPVDEANADYLRIEESSSNVRKLILVDGTEVFFRGTAHGLVPEVGYESLELRKSNNKYFLEDHLGNTTTFLKQIDSRYYPVEMEQADNSHSTTATYIFSNGQVKLSRVVGPAGPGVSCPPNAQSAGCRSIRFVYSNTTSASGTLPSQLGDYEGRLSAVHFEAAAPATNAMQSIVIARYQYGSDGRLRAYWDPRISPVSKELYEYDSQGLITSLQPAGEAPYELQYGSLAGDETPGRLLQSSRPFEGDDLVTKIEYEVPIDGEDAPWDMSAASVLTWGQTDIPQDATAVYPQTSEPGEQDLSSASIYYLNRNGRGVNLATPTGIETTEYNDFGQVSRTLSSSARVKSLDDEDSAARSFELDTRSTYSDDGLELLETLEPLQTVTLSSGTVVQARPREIMTYDEGAPGVYHLPTTTRKGAYVPSTDSFVDVRTTSTGYANGGWRHRVATEETIDPDGLSITNSTTIDPSTGLTLETSMPSSSGSDNHHRSLRIYYTAGPNAIDAFCGSKPVWAGELCSIRPKQQPTGSGPKLRHTYFTYNIWGEVERTVENNYDGATRVTTNEFDSAGRVVKLSATSTQGQPVPPVHTEYDAAGNVVAISMDVAGGDDPTIEKVYDSLGRLISYRDADDVVSTLAYDSSDRVVTEFDGMATREYEYDATTGLTVSVSDSQFGTSEIEYDSVGRQVAETMPNGVRTELTYNEVDVPVSLSHTQTDGAYASYEIATDVRVPNIFGQWTHAVESFENGSTERAMGYEYDAASRIVGSETLSEEADCSRRAYEYDENSNRTRLIEAGAAADGSCTTIGSAPSINYAYDQGDRLVASGVEYDGLGRMTEVPSSLAGGANLSLTYFANDRVRSMEQGATTVEFALDPTSRVRARQLASGLEVTHYKDDSDIASWTSFDANNWSRSSSSTMGLAIATKTVSSSTDEIEYGLTNLRGDTIWIAGGDVGSIGGSRAERFDEFGIPEDGETAQRFGWLGAQQRATELPSGVISMGSRVYVPTVGRFLQVDPVSGGSWNDYDYAYQDPVNLTDLDGECPMCGPAGLAIGRVAVAAIKSAGKKGAPRAKRAAAKVRKVMPKKGRKFTVKNVRRLITTVAQWAGKYIARAYKKSCFVNKRLRPGSFLNRGKRFRFGYSGVDGRQTIRAAGTWTESVMGTKHVFFWESKKMAQYKPPPDPC